MANSTYPQIDIARSRGRLILAVCVLASGLGFLKSSSVAVALPVIQRALELGVGDIQWIANSYLLTLGSLILLSGSLGDIFGVERTFRLGIAILGAAGLFAALSWSAPSLAVFHAFQGVGAALMIPGSLSIIRRTFPAAEQGRVIGVWAGWSGAIAAFGPFVGGALADISWRLVFALPVPFAVAALAVSLKVLPRFHRRASKNIDWTGAFLVVPALFGLSWAVIRFPHARLSVDVLAAAAVGLLSIVGFVFVERRAANPLVPGSMLNRTVTGANLATFFQYFAFSGTLFLLSFGLQQLAGLPAASAGFALLPATVLIAVGSGPSGRVTDSHGPVLQMRFGPLVFLVGAIVLALAVFEGGAGGVGVADGDYAAFIRFSVLGVSIVGVGMVLIIPAITTSALATGTHLAGAASGVNNALSRVAGFFANAVVGSVLIGRFRATSEQLLRAGGAPESVRSRVAGAADRLLEIDVQSIASAEMGAGATDGRAAQTAIAGELAAALTAAFRLAYSQAMLVNIAAAAAAFFCALLIRRGSSGGPTSPPSADTRRSTENTEQFRPERRR